MKCFAEGFRGHCMALEVNCCVGYRNCKFFKTEEQQKAEEKQCFERIAHLPKSQQDKIADTYYNGKKPWGDKYD